ncbi:hypothetical protein LBMAG42_16820 [Deltaproteobacteria bacterium]|nr:hypothetical protein LBMAG42_16820 [Deltaproteobacteria bacterium]
MWMVLLLSIFRPAHACRPEREDYAQKVVPPDGETGFPTDGAIRVLTSGTGAREVVPELAQEYRLRGPDGDLVAWRAHVHDLLLTLVPNAALRPEAAYVIERKFLYRGGLLLTDSLRMRLALSMADAPPSDAGLRWYPEARFTTSAGSESRPQQPAVSVSGTWQSAGSCGPGEHLEITATLPAGALATDLYILEVRDQAAVGFTTVNLDRPQAYFGIGHDTNHPTGPHIDVERDLEVRASLLTAAGARLGTSDWVIATSKDADAHVASRHPHDDVGGWVHAWGTAVHTAFFASPDDDSPREAPPGPEGCPFGLVATELSVEPVGALLASKSGDMRGRGRWRLQWGPRGLVTFPDVPFYSTRPRFTYRVAGSGVRAAGTARHSVEYASEVLGIPLADQPSVVLARSGTGSVAAWITEDLAQVAWLDRGGGTTGPFTLPASSGHARPELAVVDRDGLAAVAWSDGRSDGWSAAVVDRSGRSSASLAQPRGDSFALGVVGRDFVAADLQWQRDPPRALRLDCRLEAPFGAPEVLATE